MASRTSGIASVARFATLALIILATTDSRAETLEQVCQDLDRAPRTSCAMDASRTDEWVLRTGYQIGSGSKNSLEPVEARFCDAARGAGVTGRVRRSSELPGSQGEGAVMAWICEPPAVSSAPKRR